MKNVLSLLVAYVLFQTQSWALVGGPQYPGGNLVLTGTYSGVLVPDSPQVGTSLSGQALPASVVSVGLFSIGVPTVGLASGATVFFVNGDPYTGTITGLADPDKGTLVGIIKTVSDFTLVDPNFPGVTFIINATGTLQADIFSVTTAAANATTPAAGTTRVLGTATIAVSGGGPGYDGVFTYIVDGFKQSETSSTITTLPGLGGGSGN